MEDTNLLKTQSTSEDQTQHNFPQFPDPTIETMNSTPKSMKKCQHRYIFEDTNSHLPQFPDLTNETMNFTPKSTTKIFTAKGFYKMLSKINSEMIQVREEIAEIKEHVLQQNTSSNACLNGTEPIGSSTSTFDTDLSDLTDGQFKAAENKLNEPAYLTLLVNDLKKLRRTDCEHVVNNSLAYILSNHCKGKGTKGSFSNDFKQLNKAILILVRYTKPELTIKIYGEIVAKWLVQSPQRFKREEAKKRKGQKNTAIR
ncbi:Uncharacterized protein FWK35_00016892 [Aphis craccivora]|uniref:DUF4806 domain-containing protein n=1 Tax=Aphis craccivora TaxID=307492 RepID=A0A6G0Y6N5_APHCR|nr:Uncharacterized protein FWK35_00016892 [Aphis craccivora]